MQAATMRRFKWFWAWQDEKEEEWLRSMAQDGWHLVSLVPAMYTFERGEARDDVYRLDFVTAATDTEEYLQIFADAGWEHVGVQSGWQYFRRPASAGKTDEIYTDPTSKAQKYRRLLGFLIIFTPMYSSLFVIFVTRSGRPNWTVVIAVVMAAISVIWGVLLVMIGRRIKQLENS